MRFSERMGHKPIKSEIQLTSIDIDLKHSLWNAFFIYCIENETAESFSYSHFKYLYKSFWQDFLKLPLDTLDERISIIHRKIREWFTKADWCEIYDFLEFVSSFLSDGFRKYCNVMLERELSGYRFVDENISQITDEQEIKEIERALEKTKVFFGTHTHLKSALAKLSDRKNPDFRNSIKESISAVESMCQLITGDTKAELGKALKKLEEKVQIHGALKSGFTSIYGFTSDEGGIRHAMLEESSIDFEDAQYMLIACSAFINYLILKTIKAGIKIK